MSVEKSATEVCRNSESQFILLTTTGDLLNWSWEKRNHNTITDLLNSNTKNKSRKKLIRAIYDYQVMNQASHAIYTFWCRFSWENFRNKL